MVIWKWLNLPAANRIFPSPPPPSPLGQLREFEPFIILPLCGDTNIIFARTKPPSIAVTTLHYRERDRDFIEENSKKKYPLPRGKFFDAKTQFISFLNFDLWTFVPFPSLSNRKRFTVRGRHSIWPKISKQFHPSIMYSISSWVFYVGFSHPFSVYSFHPRSSTPFYLLFTVPRARWNFR